LKRSVGLVVMTQIPDDAGVNQIVAVLQKRSCYSLERMAPRFYPGCLQVTCHGKLEPDEDWENGLLRELGEELGKPLARIYLDCAHHRQVLISQQTPREEVVTYGTIIPIEIIRDYARLDPDSGGLVFVTAEQVAEIVEITDDMKVKGPEYTHTLAMFPDEAEAVKKAFELIGKM